MKLTVYRSELTDDNMRLGHKVAALLAYEKHLRKNEQEHGFTEIDLAPECYDLLYYDSEEKKDGITFAGELYGDVKWFVIDCLTVQMMHEYENGFRTVAAEYENMQYLAEWLVEMGIIKATELYLEMLGSFSLYSIKINQSTEAHLVAKHKKGVS